MDFSLDYSIILRDIPKNVTDIEIREYLEQEIDEKYIKESLINEAIEDFIRR